jgi:hypothetical protein
MKRFIPLLFLVIFSLQVNAQSKSTLIYGDALIKDRRMEKIGTALTVAGGITLFTGNILYWKTYNHNGNNKPDKNMATNAGYIMIAGVGMMAVGIPLWAIGKSRERHIRIEAELVRFKGLVSANGLGLKIRF